MCFLHVSLWHSPFLILMTCARWLNIPAKSWLTHAWGSQWASQNYNGVKRTLDSVRIPVFLSKLCISLAPTFQVCQSITLSPSFLLKIDMLFYKVIIYLNMYYICLLLFYKVIGIKWDCIFIFIYVYRYIHIYTHTCWPCDMQELSINI